MLATIICRVDPCDIQTVEIAMCVLVNIALCLLISTAIPAKGSYLNGTNIVVGVISSGEFSESNVRSLWGPTFETLLSESVGRKLSPPRNFSIVLLDIATSFPMVEEKNVDFIFATPSLFACLEAEYSGAQLIFSHIRLKIVDTM